jgi:hypothetical protein
MTQADDLTGNEPTIYEPSDLTGNEPVLGGPLGDGRAWEQLLPNEYAKCYEELQARIGRALDVATRRWTYGFFGIPRDHVLVAVADKVKPGDRLIEDAAGNIVRFVNPRDTIFGTALEYGQKDDRVWVELAK